MSDWRFNGMGDERRRARQRVTDRRHHAIRQRAEAMRLRSDGLTLEASGWEMGVTRERVRQLVNAGMSDPTAYMLYVVNVVDWSAPRKPEDNA